MAAWGDFSALTKSEGAGLEGDARRDWARMQIRARIDAVVCSDHISSIHQVAPASLHAWTIVTASGLPAFVLPAAIMS